MAQLVVSTAAAALTFAATGSPQLAAAAFAVTSALTAPKPPAPSPLDTKWTGLEYGTPIPWFIGTMRLSAIPIYLGEKVAVEQTAEGGKGGDEVTTGYEYYADVMFLIADNESAALLDVIKAGRRAWTSRSEATAQQLANSANSDSWEEIRFYGGADDQLPDPDYEADVGVGLAPAYIGRTTVFIKRLHLDGSAQLPQLHFIATTDATAGSDEVVLFRLNTDESEVGGRTVTVTGSPVFGSATTVFGGAGEFSGGEYVTVPVTMGSPGDLPITMECWFRQTSNMNSTAINSFMELMPESGGDFYLRLGWRTYGFQFISEAGEGIEYQYDPPGSAPIDTWVFVRACFRPSDGQMWLFVGLAGGQAQLVANGIIPTLIGGAGAGAHVVHVGQRAAPNNGTAVAIIDDARVTIGRLRSTAAFSVPTEPLPYDPQSTYTPVDPDLADVVTALHVRAGQSPALLDVSDLVGTSVNGVIAGQVQPVRQVLQQLATGYYFDRVESGGLIKYVDRGQASVVAIPFADLGVGVDGAAEEPLTVEIGNDLEVPNEWVCKFISRRGNRYEPGAQHSDRLTTDARGVQTVSLGIAFRENEAKGRAQSFALDAAVARTNFSFALGLKYAYLEPTDVVTLTARSGTTYRARIGEVSEAQGVLQCKAVLDDPYALRAEGVTVSDESPMDIAAPGETSMVLLDIAALQPSEVTSLGHLVAATGTGTWSGASIRRSIDGADFSSIAATVTDSAVAGTATSALSANPPLHREDLYGSLTVRVIGNLSSSTRSAMQADRTINVLAVETSSGFWEVIRFRTATLTGTDGDFNLYTLSGLQRGRRGSESLVGLHTSGDRVVLLRASQGLRNVSTELASINLTRYWRGVTLGRSIGSATTVEFADTGVREKPFAPAYLRVARDGSNNATVTLQPRTRAFGRYGGPGGSVIPASDADSFSIDVYADDTFTTVVRTLAGAQAGISYSAANQTSDGLTPGDPLNLRAYQVSTTVGRGYALEAEA